MTERKADLFQHHSTELRNTSQWSSFIYDSITGDNDFNFWDCYGYCINRQECDAFVFNRYETKCYLGNLATKERLFFEGPPTIQELFILSRRKFKIPDIDRYIRSFMISMIFFPITEQNPFFKRFESMSSIDDQDESKGYEISHEEPQFPADLFKQFLYREIKFNSIENLARKCENICLLRNYAPDFPVPLTECGLIYVHEERSTCYLGSFNYTFGLPGASFGPPEIQDNVEFSNPIRAIDSNMMDPYDFQKWIPENLTELDGTCHGDQVIKVDDYYEFVKEFSIDASSEECRIFVHNPFFRLGKIQMSAGSTGTVNCYQLGNDECSRILSVTTKPYQMPSPFDWRQPDPLTYSMDSCKSTLEHEWSTPVATIKYNRGVCQVEKATFKLQFVRNEP